MARPDGDMTRSPLLLGVLAGALALGACGASNDDGATTGGTAGQGDKAFQGALNFAKCMREHGIDFPDPQRVGQGGIKMTMKGGPARCRRACRGRPRRRA